MNDDDDDEFRKSFPKLSKELDDDSINIPITSIRSEDSTQENEKQVLSDELRNPDVISFIRRADTDEDALEIIDFLLKRGEIIEEYANELKLQLGMMGVRSFGTKKEPGYYEKKYRYKEKKRNEDKNKINNDL